MCTYDSKEKGILITIIIVIIVLRRASQDDRDWTTRTEEKLLNDNNLYGKRIVLGNSRLAQSCTGKRS